ncbi:Protein FAR1-RELATED SEQUENCE 5 [Abeliophyllum distichum]|uniref:Protein FAR1-RELATED SEQUENCE 5 n=1 Tax=Abeliophyllum distichum TaxID=126358 RepID=A0ABD1SSS7_9LAMI
MNLTTPSKVHLLRTHRSVSATKMALAQQFLEANIPTCQQLRIMEIDAGDPDSVGYVERDLRNHERNIREELKGYDAETLIGSYAFFGDAVVFDTTYNTNKYSMIFAPFVGVNNHGQTILFGCGLLSDESTESFVWLLSKFMDAMSGQAPQIIITDQDEAIAKAISMVLPLTFHRYCIWHILNKFSEKINVMVHNEEYHMLVNVIKTSESPDELEGRWSAIMESSNLGCNEWLCSMFALRSRWVPAYVKHIFSAGMSSGQRLESGHSFFKRYFKNKQVLLLPDKYILRRWTKNAKVIVVEYPSASISDGGSSSSSLLSRHGMLAHRSSLLVDDASLRDARTSYLMEEFARMHVRVKAIDDGGNVGLTKSMNKNTKEYITIHDPSFVRAKGCGKILKSSKEKSMAKNSRQCSACGQNGHDKRTCHMSTRETYQPAMNDQVHMQDEGRSDATFMSYASSQCDMGNWFL